MGGEWVARCGLASRKGYIGVVFAGGVLAGAKGEGWLFSRDLVGRRWWQGDLCVNGWAASRRKAGGGARWAVGLWGRGTERSCSGDDALLRRGLRRGIGLVGDWGAWQGRMEGSGDESAGA